MTMRTQECHVHYFRVQSLSHCEQITDEGLRQIALSPCAAEHLAVLELDNCPNITDNGLNHLMQACHNLERIELYDCLHISREGIRKLRVLSYSIHIFIAMITRCAQARRVEKKIIFSIRHLRMINTIFISLLNYIL